jgi:simple sugar transport system permease protein
VKLNNRTAITVFVVTLFSLLLALISSHDNVSVKISTDHDAFKLGLIELPVFGTLWTCAWLSIAMSALALTMRWILKRKVSGLITGLNFVFFAWAALVYLYHGNTMTLTSLLQGSLALSVPLIFGSMSGVLSERVGVVNIAIEGQLLFGAFTSAMVTTLTHSLWLGLISALVAGSLVAWLLAVFSIKYRVDQIIVGVVVNVLVAGLTNFLYGTLMQGNPFVFNQPERFKDLPIPGLSGIPIIGPVFFNQTAIVYLMYVALAVVYIALFKTKWGLRVRAVGEYPKAADTVGIDVFRTRYTSVLIGGALAGLGGSFFTLGEVGAFGQNMTNGAGYIALAALIFGRWNPLLAACAALLFGFAENLQYGLAIIGSPLPSEFLLMLPYVLTVIAVAGLVGKVTGPAASGKPYIKQ